MQDISAAVVEGSSATLSVRLINMRDSQSLGCTSEPIPIRFQAFHDTARQFNCAFYVDVPRHDSLHDSLRVPLTDESLKTSSAYHVSRGAKEFPLYVSVYLEAKLRVYVMRLSGDGPSVEICMPLPISATDFDQYRTGRSRSFSVGVSVPAALSRLFDSSRSDGTLDGFFYVDVPNRRGHSLGSVQVPLTNESLKESLAYNASMGSKNFLRLYVSKYGIDEYV